MVISGGQSPLGNLPTAIFPRMFCRKNWRQRCHHRRKKLTPQDVADLSQPITIESRGGKIANSHDGLTFFYTRLPTSQNFILQATVTVNQFGPENGARPAAQEGAGLLVRDVIGVPRQQPLKVGYEEFPAASNMVMNAIMTQDKKMAHISNCRLSAGKG